MIRSSPLGVSPRLVVAINDVQIDYTSLMSVTLDLAENQHDLCKITMSGVPSRSITDFIGKNVQVQIDTGSTMVSTFYGSVERPRPTASTSGGLVNNSLFQEVEFSCLGCSYGMRGSTARSWAGHRLEDVARNYCNTYGFSLDVPSDDLVFSHLEQTDESDWQFLVRYANLMGYSVTVHGTHVHIFDPFKAKGRLISLNRLAAPGRSTAQPVPGQIVKFDGNLAKRALDGRGMDSSVTVLTDAGTTYDVFTSDIERQATRAPIVKNEPNTADNYSEAERMIRASYRKEYDYRAKVTTLGAAGMYPGGLANVDGYGGDFDGLWYVASVCHEVRSGSFLTYSDLRRNRTDTLVDVSVAQFRPPPLPKSIDGVWTSTSRLINVY